MSSKIYGIAGQVKPVAGLAAGLFSPSAGKQFVASTLSVCNQSNTDVDSFWVQIVPAGQQPSDAGFIYFDKPIDPRDTKNITIGISLNAGDNILVKSASGNLSFNLFGAIIG